MYNKDILEKTVIAIIDALTGKIDDFEEIIEELPQEVRKLILESIIDTYKKLSNNKE